MLLMLQTNLFWYLKGYIESNKDLNRARNKLLWLCLSKTQRTDFILYK